MDPISASSGAITILLAVNKSCRFLYDFLQGFSEAPAKIRKHCELIQALHAVFTSLIELLQSIEPPLEPRADFLRKLQAVCDEIERTKRSLSQLKGVQNRGPTQRVLTRLKWTFSGDERLNQALERLRPWHSVFSYELDAIQIGMLRDLRAQRGSLAICQFSQGSCLEPRKVIQRPLIETCRTVGPPWALETAQESRLVSEETGNNSLPPRAARYLHAKREPAGLQPQQVYKLCARHVVVGLRHGPVVCRKWSLKYREVFEEAVVSLGVELSVLFRPAGYRSFKISLAILGITEDGSPLVSTSLSVATVVPHDASVFEAVKRGDCETLRDLLNARRACIRDITLTGDTLLHFAVRHRQHEVIAILLERNADVNKPNDAGESPLHLAVRLCAGSPTARLLLDGGADLSRQNNEGQTPLQTFYTATAATVLELAARSLSLADIPADNRALTLLHYLSWTKQSTSAQVLRLRPRPVDLTRRDDWGRSVLHLAAKRGNLDLMAYYLDLDCAAELARADAHGRGLMHHATESGRAVAAIDLLHARGFDVCAVDRNGGTTLHHATARNQVAAARRLLELGAGRDAFARDTQRRTPLQVARAYEAGAVLALLCERYKPAEIDLMGELPEAQTKHSPRVRFEYLWLGSLRGGWTLLIGAFWAYTPVVLCVLVLLDIVCLEWATFRMADDGAGLSLWGEKRR